MIFYFFTEIYSVKTKSLHMDHAYFVFKETYYYKPQSYIHPLHMDRDFLCLD